MANQKQAEQMRSGDGFIAALDQSGGSTPKVLGQYGISDDAWSNEAEMFDLMHGFRARIIKSPAFTGEKVIAAILFEMTMEREIDGLPSAQYLWEKRGVVPLLKVDRGLAEPSGDVRLMQPIDDLDDLCRRGVAAGIFGTKMRSVIDAATADGIAKIVDQQFDIGNRIIGHGLVPILEPEITISITDKAEAEQLLLDALLKGLEVVPDGKEVMFKLTLPEEANLYRPLVDHPKVMRVVALSGGYSRDEANRRLAQNSGMIASFSRALAEGLTAQQTDAEFDAMLAASIDSIYRASVAG